MSLRDAFRPGGCESAARLADALRTLQAVALTPDFADDRLERATRAVEAALAELGGVAPASRYPPGEAGPFTATHPVIGPVNAVAPPLTLDDENGTALATGIYGPSYEGPPGAVQGGHIAAGFDIVLAYGAVLEGLLGYTGTLTVTYREPTPIGRPIRYEGRCERVEGRKAEIVGRLLLEDGTTTASSTGVFVRRASGPGGR